MMGTPFSPQVSDSALIFAISVAAGATTTTASSSSSTGVSPNLSKATTLWPSAPAQSRVARAAAPVSGRMMRSLVKPLTERPFANTLVKGMLFLRVVYVSSLLTSTSILNLPHPFLITSTEDNSACTTAFSILEGMPFSDFIPGVILNMPAASSPTSAEAISSSFFFSSSCTLNFLSSSSMRSIWSSVHPSWIAPALLDPAS
mmetsp:Transcript_21085/g.48388  ORF Transcript_21085/g.48388 Transcript_21085/m.48388 type:complete len:202 (-) Transcript_21085:672-1277(-)